eukprot:UN19403
MLRQLIVNLDSFVSIRSCNINQNEEINSNTRKNYHSNKNTSFVWSNHAMFLTIGKRAIPSRILKVYGLDEIY